VLGANFPRFGSISGHRSMSRTQLMPASAHKFAGAAMRSMGKNHAIATSIAIGELSGVGARSGSTTPTVTVELVPTPQSNS
jgi:hypothetical protein